MATKDTEIANRQKRDSFSLRFAIADRVSSRKKKTQGEAVLHPGLNRLRLRVFVIRLDRCPYGVADGEAEGSAVLW
jgi:hypothetical protein